MAVGVSNDAARDRALCETVEPTEPMPYNNADEFAIWCKTLMNPVQWKVASALAAARMVGRVWVWVCAVEELRTGDHISFNSGSMFFYQHAIVSHIEGTVSYRSTRFLLVQSYAVSVFVLVSCIHLLQVGIA